MNKMQVTEDRILNGKITLLQPKDGYRVAVDPLLLAASVDVRPGQSILDVGAGVGTAMLCLASRVSNCHITGIEKQIELSDLAQKNITQNGFADQLTVINGDITDSTALNPGSFHHVMTNPPFLEQTKSITSSQKLKALANHESTASLKGWLDFCLQMLVPKGHINLIHRADRLDELLPLMQGKFGGVTVFPLWPKQSRPAKRVLIQARKLIKSPLRLASGLVLHEASGKYTAAAQAILSGKGLIDFGDLAT